MRGRRTGYRSPFPAKRTPFPNPSGHRGYSRPRMGVGKAGRQPNLYPRVKNVAGRNTQRPYGAAVSRNRVAGVRRMASAHSHHVRGRIRRTTLRARQRRRR